jgi:hypothetical protein
MADGFFAKEESMARAPINPGKVDWTGENPGIYLKEAEDGPYTAVASFFRVIASPHGAGHALFLITEAKGGLNAILADNRPLAEYLRAHFVSSFASFKGHPALPGLPVRPAAVMPPAGDARAAWTESMAGDGVRVSLTWSGLGEPFLVEIPRDRSATGAHELFSVFIEAERADLVVNGVRIPGRVTPRDFQGRRSSNAFLAFSETWVRV